MSEIVQSKSSATAVLGYLVALLLVVAIGVLATVRLNQISAAVNDLTNNLAADMALSKEIASQVLLVRLSANRYVRTQNQADLDRFHIEFAGLKVLLNQASEQVTDPERGEMLDRIVPAVEGYGDAFDKVAELIRERQRIQSEVLDVQGFLIENKLIALRVHVISLNDPLAFLAQGNAQDAFQWMRLNTAKYLEEGDERYAVMFGASYQQARAAFAGLEAISQDAVQRENSTEAKAAADAYHTGFQTIHADYVELKDLFETKLDVLEPEISNAASEVVTSIEREFKSRNELSQSLILQTRLVLLATTAIAILAGLSLGLVLHRRIAERVRAEEELRRYRDHLEELIQERTVELESFSYSVSHDLRAPLRHIDGFVSLLLQREGERLDETSTRYLNVVRESVDKMGQLIDDLLALSRTGRTEMRFQRVELGELLEAARQELAAEVRGRHIAWEIDSLPPVEGDPALLRQVWTNLLSNAIKYTAPRDEAYIEIGTVQGVTSDVVGEGRVTLYCRDNGVGFDPQYADKLFGVFQRLHQEGEFEGTGVGLAIVRRIVHRHGGRVWAEGQPDGGATFYLTLKAACEGSARNTRRERGENGTT